MSQQQAGCPAGGGRVERDWVRRSVAGHGAECLLLAALFSLVFAVGISCEGKAQEDPLVLTVGAREVRQEELERAFWEKQRGDRSLRPDSSGLNRFLPGYIDDLIWQEVARREIPELEPVAQIRLDEFKEQKMVEILREEAYMKKARAGDARIREAYETLGRLLHLRYLLVPTREEAETALEAVRQGAVFAKVAERESRDERSRANGGDIGWVTYYDLDPEVRDKVFRLKPGDLAGPFTWTDGWQLFQVVEEKPNPARGTYEAERARLQQGLSMAATIEGKRAYLDGLFRKYELTFDPAEVAWMTAFLREKTQSVPRDPSQYSAEDLEDPEFKRKYLGNPFPSNPVTPADSGRVVATFLDVAGGRQSVKPILVIDQLLTDAPLSWPKFEKTDDVEAIIRELVLERLEVYEAEKAGIPDRPQYLRLVHEKEGEIRARYFFRTRLRPRAVPTDEEVRAYYDAHPEEFSQPEQRRFLALSGATPESARKIRDLFRAGKQPSEIRAALLEQDPGMKGTGDEGTPPFRYGQSTALDPFLFKLPLNGVSEPIPYDGRYTVAKVIEILPAQRTPFEEVKGDLAVKLNTSRTEELLKRTIEEARPDFPVNLRREGLRTFRYERPFGE